MISKVLLGHLIRRARTKQGMTLDNLAEFNGLSSAAISRIERGQCDATFSSLEKISEGLNMSLSCLMEMYDSLVDTYYTSYEGPTLEAGMDPVDEKVARIHISVFVDETLRKSL